MGENLQAKESEARNDKQTTLKGGQQGGVAQSSRRVKDKRPSAALKEDFNTLLSKLKAAGLMTADTKSETDGE